MNKKTCIICTDRFTPERRFQKTCGDVACNAILQVREREKAKLKEINKAKREYSATDRSKLLKLAQSTFNLYIRTRDGKYCISCKFEPHIKNGKLIDRQFHAGHYKSQGGNSALRFDEDNVHTQCSICNNHLSGNLANYRMNLIEKIGIEKVEKLECNKTTKRWSVEELKEIISTYKTKTKGLIHE